MLMQFRVADLLLWTLLTGAMVALTLTTRGRVGDWVVAAIGLALCLAASRGASQQWGWKHRGAWLQRLAYWVFVGSFLTPPAHIFSTPVQGWQAAILMVESLVRALSPSGASDWSEWLYLVWNGCILTLGNVAALATPWFDRPRPRWDRWRALLLGLAAISTAVLFLEDAGSWEIGFYLWSVSLWVLAVQSIWNWLRNRNHSASRTAPTTASNHVTAAD